MSNPQTTANTEILDGVKEFRLSQVIDRDPLTWTDIDIDGLVTYYRRYREKFLQEDNKAKSAGKALQSKTVAKNLTLDDLGLKP